MDLHICEVMQYSISSLTGIWSKRDWASCSLTGCTSFSVRLVRSNLTPQLISNPTPPGETIAFGSWNRHFAINISINNNISFFFTFNISLGPVQLQKKFPRVSIKRSLLINFQSKNKLINKFLGLSLVWSFQCNLTQILF